MSCIDHHRKIVFIHVPKTAGTSMENSGVLSGRGHTTMTEYALSAPASADYFKFAFVRNPWERLVSAYFFFLNMSKDYWMYKDNEAIIAVIRSYSSFSEFAIKLTEACLWPHARVFWPQSALVCLPSGEIGVDFVGRYEQLDRDWKRVCRTLGVEHDVRLPRDNLSRHRHYSEYYGRKERACVARLYASDLRLFGYDWLS